MTGVGLGTRTHQLELASEHTGTTESEMSTLSQNSHQPSVVLSVRVYGKVCFGSLHVTWNSEYNEMS